MFFESKKSFLKLTKKSILKFSKFQKNASFFQNQLFKKWALKNFLDDLWMIQHRETPLYRYLRTQWYHFQHDWSDIGEIRQNVRLDWKTSRRFFSRFNLSRLRKLVHFLLARRAKRLFSSISLVWFWFCYCCVRKYRLQMRNGLGFFIRLLENFLELIFWKVGFEKMKRFFFKFWKLKKNYFVSFKNNFFDPKSNRKYLREFLRLFYGRKCVWKPRIHTFRKKYFHGTQKFLLA